LQVEASGLPFEKVEIESDLLVEEQDSQGPLEEEEIVLANTLSRHGVD
jgi:hypothetical protein